MVGTVKEKESSIGISVKEGIICCCVILLASILVASFSFNRTYFTYSTETDFISRNLADAQRLLEGEPMQLEFHPPFYSIVLAPLQAVFRDWFKTGLVLSWISCVIVLLCNFLLFHQIGGRYAAWGSLLGLLTSRLFLTYSSYATQDVFFLAIYSSCFLLAFTAIRTGTRFLWGVTGVILGCALLTRANGLSLLILLAFPMLSPRDFRGRLKDIACILAACGFVLLTWGLFAKATGSPFGTRYGHLNMAMRYFPAEGDPFSVEARQHLAAKFSNYKQVLLHDPKHMAVTYVKDSFQYLKRNFLSQELVTFPVLLFSLPGIFLLFFRPRSDLAIPFLVATVFQVALLSFKEYESRFYLFLIPVFAAGAGVSIQHIRTQIPKGWSRIGALILFLPFLLSYAKETRYVLAETYGDLHAQDPELGEILPTAGKLVDREGVFVSRREHIPFYLGIQHAKFPDVKNVGDFRSWIDDLPGKGPVYVYYGPDERLHRPRVSELNFPERAPDWLEPLAQSKVRNRWALYKVRPLPPPVQTPRIPGSRGDRGKNE